MATTPSSSLLWTDTSSVLNEDEDVLIPGNASTRRKMLMLDFSRLPSC